MEEWGWKNGDCVGNRVNRMSVQAGGQTNNGLVSDAEIRQAGSGIERAGCGLGREENSLRAPLVLESESTRQGTEIRMFSSHFS